MINRNRTCHLRLSFRWYNMHAWNSFLGTLCMCVFGYYSINFCLYHCRCSHTLLLLFFFFGYHSIHMFRHYFDDYVKRCVHFYWACKLLHLLVNIKFQNMQTNEEKACNSRFFLCTLCVAIIGQCVETLVAMYVLQMKCINYCLTNALYSWLCYRYPQFLSPCHSVVLLISNQFIIKNR